MLADGTRNQLGRESASYSREPLASYPRDPSSSYSRDPPSSPYSAFFRPTPSPCSTYQVAAKSAQIQQSDENDNRIIHRYPSLYKSKWFKTGLLTLPVPVIVPGIFKASLERILHKWYEVEHLMTVMAVIVMMMTIKMMVSLSTKTSHKELYALSISS